MYQEFNDISCKKKQNISCCARFNHVLPWHAELTCAGPPEHMGTWGLETVQDFLIKLGIKPLIHLLEISIFH